MTNKLNLKHVMNHFVALKICQKNTI